jgi:hypothetical protein
VCQCLLACVFEKMGAFSAGGRLLNGDNIMPIMDRLYGFKEYQTVLRAQLVHNCVDQGNYILMHVNGYHGNELPNVNTLHENILYLLYYIMYLLYYIFQI